MDRTASPNAGFIQTINQMRQNLLAGQRRQDSSLTNNTSIKIQNQTLANLSAMNRTLNSIRQILSNSVVTATRSNQNLSRITTETNNTIKNLNRSINSMSNAIQKSISGLAGGVRNVAGAGFSFLSSDFAMSALKKLLGLAAGGIVGKMLFDQLPESTKKGIYSGFSKLFTGMVDFVSPLFEKAFNKISMYAEIFGKTITDYFSNLKFDFSPLVENITQSIGKAIKNALSFLIDPKVLIGIITFGGVLKQLIKYLPAIITASKGGGVAKDAAVAALGAGGLGAMMARASGALRTVNPLVAGGMAATIWGLSNVKEYKELPEAMKQRLEKDKELGMFPYVGAREVIPEDQGTNVSEGTGAPSPPTKNEKQKIKDQIANFNAEEERRNGPSYENLIKQLKQYVDEFKLQSGEIAGYTENYVYVTKITNGNISFDRYNKTQYQNQLKQQVINFGDFDDSSDYKEILKLLREEKGSASILPTGSVFARTPLTTKNTRLPENFLNKVVEISKSLSLNPQDLLDVMGFETGGTFSPSKKNPQSSATGLIQFTKETAEEMGTTTEKLSKMSQLEQLEYVKKYLEGKLKNVKKEAGNLFSIGQLYTAIAIPSALKQDISYERGTSQYEKNKIWDVNKDGKITKEDIERFAENMALHQVDDERFKIVAQYAKQNNMSVKDVLNEIRLKGFVTITNTGESFLEILKRNKEHYENKYKSKLEEEETSVIGSIIKDTIGSNVLEMLNTFSNVSKSNDLEKIKSDLLQKLDIQSKTGSSTPLAAAPTINNTYVMGNEKNNAGVPSMTAISATSYNSSHTFHNISGTVLIPAYS